MEQSTQSMDGGQNGDDVDDDPRFTLTPWERESVIRLKNACDAEGIAYKSIFELAKYVLVTRSMANDHNSHRDQIRLNAALKRIKKRRAWEAKIGFDAIDPVAAIEEVDKVAPEYFVNHYIKDTEGCVLHCNFPVHSPLSYMNASHENATKVIVAEQYRSELCAADMVEARIGIAMLSLSDDKLNIASSAHCLRFLKKIRVNLKDMHCHRMKRIYAEVPGFCSHLVRPALALLPGKIARRVIVAKNLEELERHVAERAPQGKAVLEWVSERQSIMNETLEKLKL
jgi:hypothetical protein